MFGHHKGAAIVAVPPAPQLSVLLNPGSDTPEPISCAGTARDADLIDDTITPARRRHCGSKRVRT